MHSQQVGFEMPGNDAPALGDKDLVARHYENSIFPPLFQSHLSGFRKPVIIPVSSL